MTTYRCYDCGYETTVQSAFLATQGDGNHHWTIFQCPQCSASPAKVAASGDNPPWDKPVWSVEATNYGLYIVAESKSGAINASPMIPSHQLASMPAARYFPGEQGSMRDFHNRLVQRGQDRMTEFQSDTKALRSQYPTFLTDGQIAMYQAGMDLLRKRHNVGPYDTKLTARVQA